MGDLGQLDLVIGLCAVEGVVWEHCASRSELGTAQRAGSADQLVQDLRSAECRSVPALPSLSPCRTRMMR
eukprot:2776319-Rhodomonas_salina.1